MKIVQIIFALGPGGAERFVTDLSNYLASDNEVYLCIICTEKVQSASFLKSDLNDQINYINLGRKKGLNLKTFFSIFSLIKQIKPDVVHAHLNVLIYLYLPALFYHKKVKFVHTLHSTASKAAGFKLQKQINSFFYKRHIQPVTISRDTKLSYEEFYGLNNSVLIVNGRDNLKKSLAFIDVSNEIEKYKNNSEDVVCVHIARYDEAKNQEMLFEAFKTLIKQKNHLILMVLGAGFENGEGAKLKEKYKNYIYFLGPVQNVGDYLLCSDVFCLTSLWEGMPISLLEAISCGIIPICTPAGGIPDVIIDGKYGYLSKDFSKDEYMNAINRYLKHPNQISKKSLKEYFQSNYSMKSCGNKYIKLYKNQYHD